jgi:hypothetical protein
MAAGASPKLDAGKFQLRGLLLGGSAGMVLTYAASELLRAEPKLFADAVVKAFIQWGPLFILCILGLVIANRWGQKFKRVASAVWKTLQSVGYGGVSLGEGGQSTIGGNLCCVGENCWRSRLLVLLGARRDNKVRRNESSS